MGKDILKAVSLLAAVFMVAGCNGSTAAETTTIAEEVTKETEVSEQAENSMPEGWSIEKIAALIEIDGQSLKFPCTPEEFKSISPKINLEEPDEVFNYCDIYYESENIGTFGLNRDSGYCDFVMIYTDLINDMGEVSIGGYGVEEVDDIISYLDENFHNNLVEELSEEQNKVFRYSDDESIYALSFIYNENVIEMVNLSKKQGNNT